MAEQNNVKWNNFSDHLREMFLEMYSRDSYADVTLLSAEGVEFRAHRIVLCASSSVLRNIIESSPADRPVVHQTSIESLELESVLHLMYVGEGKFYKERRAKFRKVLQNLEIEAYTGEELSWRNFSDHLQSLCRDLYRDESYADVVLVSQDGVEFRGHKFLLSASSPILKKIIDSKPVGNILKLQIESTELESILHYMYVGEGKSYAERIGLFVGVANELEIKDLSNIQVAEAEELDLKPTLSRQERKKFMCDRCDYQTHEQGRLKVHIESLHEGIKYPCDECDYKATEKGNLRKHKLCVHEKLKKYSCNLCGRKFTAIGSLRKHKENVHDKITFPCNQCEYAATAETNLRRHINYIHLKKPRHKTGSGKINYSVCPECGARYKEKRNMLEHYKSKHQGIAYICDQCDMKFTKIQSLRRHKKGIHDRITYPCCMCKYAATTKTNLKRHTTSVHEKMKKKIIREDYNMEPSKPCHVQAESSD